MCTYKVLFLSTAITDWNTNHWVYHLLDLDLCLILRQTHMESFAHCIAYCSLLPKDTIHNSTESGVVVSFSLERNQLFKRLKE